MTETDRYSQRFWDALTDLEDAIDELSVRILARTGAPPEPTSPKSSGSKSSRSKNDSDIYIERMNQLQLVASTLSQCLDAPAYDMPDDAKRRSLRRIVHPEVSGNADTALRARIGRAARRYGLSFKEWIDRYGMVDKHPNSL